MSLGGCGRSKAAADQTVDPTPAQEAPADAPKSEADARQKALEVLGEVNFWVMTARSKNREESAHNDNKFSAQAKMSDDTLNITVSGRLDTITAPELLSLYKEFAAKNRITAMAKKNNKCNNVLLTFFSPSSLS